MTLFPEVMSGVLDSSIIGRAKKKGILDIRYHNIRDYTLSRQRQVDDYPYGGGMGVIMQAQPIYDCFKAISEGLESKPHVIYMSPQGKPFNQKKAIELSKYEHLILLCGHYEGVDERVIEEICDEEISVGDFVLTGGEIAAMAVTDAVCRMIPGVLSAEECFSEESHYSGLLEYPQYSRPAEYLGRAVPDVLVGGHHANIVKWRREKSLERTLAKRPDMLVSADLTNDDKLYLKEYINGNKVLSKHMTPMQKAKLTKIIKSAVPPLVKVKRKRHTTER